MPNGFVPAICPKCGGELRISSNLTIAKCSVCGEEIILSNSRIERKIPNLLMLADRACEAKNYKEGYKYYSDILEIDPFNYVALFGKSYSVGMLSSIRNLHRLSEADTHLRLFMEYGPVEITGAPYPKTYYIPDEVQQEEFLKLAFTRLLDLGTHCLDTGKSLDFDLVSQHGFFTLHLFVLT
jgi:predicted RNA-binding Zn-ribbon protein involved in translation (DUF1610 family)